jgi:hypothetical protein
MPFYNYQYHLGTIIAMHVVLVIIFIYVLSSLLKEKERGSKGRAIYWAVGSQVTYTTPYSPLPYTLYTRYFNNLKYYFITTLILAYFDPNFKYIIKTDSSDHVLGGVLL